MKYHMSLLVCSGLLLNAPARLAHADAYISMGKMSVKANELVYGQPGTYPTVDYKLSHLIWDAKDVSVLIAGMDIPFKNGITLNIEGKFSQDGGDGTMDDYDWQVTSSPNYWTDWSHHVDTEVSDSMSLDINANIFTLGKRKNKIALFFGYKYETWSWDSRGGDYIYSTANTTDRASTGSFTAGQSVITYKQSFSTPYLGFEFAMQSNNWNYNFQYEFSNLVNVSTVDNHVLRNLIITNDYEKGRMRVYKINVGYQISYNFDVFLRYDIQDYNEVKGNSTYSGSWMGRCVNCAGADNSIKTLSVGASLMF